MSWTADSTRITADQTCWTADGGNRCLSGGVGGDDGYKQGQPLQADDHETAMRRLRDRRLLRDKIEAAYDGIDEQQLDAIVEQMPEQDVAVAIRDNDALAIIVVLWLA